MFEHEHRSRNEMQGTKCLNAVCEEPEERCTDRELGDVAECITRRADQHCGRRIKEKCDHPRELWRRAETHVSRSYVDDGAVQRKSEKQIEKRHDLQVLEELLRARVNENDERDDSGYGEHWKVWLGHR